MIKADLSYELMLVKQGYIHIAGVDEAGRGAWAGPVVAGAVILPLDWCDLVAAMDGVRDSKLLSARQREKLFPRIYDIATACAVGYATHAEIDEVGIVPATRLAMVRALRALAVPPDSLLTDAMKLPEVPLPATPLIKGDQKSLSIAAASILAKVSRDHLMIELDAQYPDYGFASHKGYGTLRHFEALRLHGPTPLHRQTFAPIRACVRRQDSNL